MVEMLPLYVLVLICIHVLYVQGYTICHDCIDGTKQSKLAFPLENNERSLQIINKDWTTGLQNVLVVRARPESISNLGAVYEQEYLDNLVEALELVKQFYASASGGIQTYEFIVDEHVYDSSILAEICDTSTTESDTNDDTSYRNVAAELVKKIQDNGFDPKLYERILFQFSHCAFFSWSGIAIVGGQHLWINGGVRASNEDDISKNRRSAQSLARTIAHELGHNNGAYHDEYRDVEYGNPFSIMGSASLGHFPVNYKYAFSWLTDDTQIVKIERNQESIPKIKLFVADKDDALPYDPSKTYGIRLETADAGEFVWIENRSGKGAMVLWEFSSAHSKTKFTGFNIMSTILPFMKKPGYVGPTQILPYNRLKREWTYDKSELLVPHDGTLVYDLAETGIVIHITDVNPDDDYIEVDVRYKPNVLQENHFTEEVVQTHAMECSEPNLPLKFDTLSTTYLDNVSHRAYDYSIVQLHVGADVHLTLRNSCPSMTPGITSDVPDYLLKYSGLYVHRNFPIPLFLSQQQYDSNLVKSHQSVLWGDVAETANDSMNVAIGAEAFYSFQSCENLSAAEEIICEEIKWNGLALGYNELTFRFRGYDSRTNSSRGYTSTDGNLYYYDNFRISSLVSRGVPIAPHLENATYTKVWTQIRSSGGYSLFLMVPDDIQREGILPVGRNLTGFEYIVANDSWTEFTVSFSCLSVELTIPIRNAYTVQKNVASYQDQQDEVFLLFAFPKNRNGNSVISTFSAEIGCSYIDRCPLNQYPEDPINEENPEFSTTLQCKGCALGEVSAGDHPCESTYVRELVGFVSFIIFIVISVHQCVCPFCKKKWSSKFSQQARVDPNRQSDK